MYYITGQYWNYLQVTRGSLSAYIWSFCASHGTKYQISVKSYTNQLEHTSTCTTFGCLWLNKPTSLRIKDNELGFFCKIGSIPKTNCSNICAMYFVFFKFYVNFYIFYFRFCIFLAFIFRILWCILCMVNILIKADKGNDIII